ncbi:hypothetical protein Tco_1274551 [Tanacetum coccineum]
MGGDGSGGDEGVLKEKSSRVIGERLSLEIEDEEDVPLVDGVLKGALGAFGDGVLASSWVRSMNNFLGGLIVIFGFLVDLEVEVYENAMELF